MYEIEDKKNREQYQMERSAARKDWIKNLAIVFLSIMLILTFFSNTIMNSSLPQTAPARTAETAIIIIFSSVVWNMETTMGTRMENVPQLVPVENEMKIETRKTMSGTMATRLPDRFRLPVTKSPMPS